MHNGLRIAFTATLVFVASFGPHAQAQSAKATLPGTDIRSWATADISSKLSLAGFWEPHKGYSTSRENGLVGPFWSVARLGAAQREGLVLNGWTVNSSMGSSTGNHIRVRALFLEQQGDGTLLDTTSLLVGDSTTNGSGSVVVADFNGDGMDDVVFPAHNESPFIATASAAWMSKPGGSLAKIDLPDRVEDHDAKVVTLGGQKRIIAKSFSAPSTPIYTWSGSNFSIDSSLEIGGMSILAGQFTGGSDDWLVIGDADWGPGITYSPQNPMLTYAYKYNNGVLTLPPVLLPKPYFNDKAEYAGFESQWDPRSKSHTSRLWTTDLNQDGLPDILAGQEIWSGSKGLQKAVFQLLVNRGNMVFEDQTDALAPEFSKDSQIDYNVRLVDVDGSGIESIFLSPPRAFKIEDDAKKQGQYILVNDGTGRLYAAMHEEFRAMSAQVIDFISTRAPAGTFVSQGITPMFMAYRTAAGALNFLAVKEMYHPSQDYYGLVSVSLGVNLATDFRRNLTVATRNGSRRIRTFAGDDVIHRAVTDPDCAIDGGLGENSVVYPGPRSSWIVARSGDQVTVRPAGGGGGTDTLTRVQRAVFDDMTVELSTLLSADAAMLDFGGQSMRTTAPARVVTLTNVGTASVTINTVSASTDFSVSHDCAVLAAGKSCAATVTFTPKSQGTMNGNLAIQSSIGTQSVPLAGTGEKSLVTHYYRSILRRAPDAGGKSYWDAEAARVQALGVNVNEVWFAMAQSFFGSPEYMALGRDDAGFVTDLYATFFNRAPDAAGLAYWTGQLGQGLPREVALAGIMFSTEFGAFTEAIFGTTATRKEADTVVDFYRGLLGALPDDGGFNYWVQQFRTAQCQGGAAVNAQVETISFAFANSPQYANRGRSHSQYVGDLYNAFLRRGGDLGGVKFWIDQVASGKQTRDQLRQAYVASPEFQGRVAAIIVQGCQP